MSDGMRRELVYLSSHATNRYFIPNWGRFLHFCVFQHKPNHITLPSQFKLNILKYKILAITNIKSCHDCHLSFGHFEFLKV